MAKKRKALPRCKDIVGGRRHKTLAVRCGRIDYLILPEPKQACVDVVRVGPNGGGRRLKHLSTRTIAKCVSNTQARRVIWANYQAS